MPEPEEEPETEVDKSRQHRIYLISERESALAQVTREGRTATVTGGRELVITIFGSFSGTERIEIYVPE